MQLDIFSTNTKETGDNPEQNFSSTQTGSNAIQLDLFSPMKDADDILTERALALLDLLNDGLKKKEKYKPHAYSQINDLMLLVAINKDNYLFNLIDLDGNTPPNFSVNWRSAQHIKQDLKEHLPD